MNFIKNILGFNSPYSWMKWLRSAIFICALYVVYIFLDIFGNIMFDEGLFGLIIVIIIFGLILFYLGSWLAIGGIIFTSIVSFFGIKKSIEKQKKSIEESRASGNEELLALDEARFKIQTRNLIVTILKVVWFVGGFFLFFSDFSFTWFSAVYGFGGIILFVVLRSAQAPREKEFNKSFKELIVKNALESVLTNLDFRPETKLDKSVIDESNLFPNYDIYNGNDYLTAEYKEIKFFQGDVHLLEEYEETYTNKDGTTETTIKYRTKFHGRLMVFHYPVISRDPVYVFDKRYKRFTDYKDEIKTELDIFNQNFSVIASNPIAAFRVLTPPVLEGIALASDKLGYPMMLSFRDDKLYFALSSGNSFESSIVGDSTLSEQRNRITGEVQTMLDVVETLYLKKDERD